MFPFNTNLVKKSSLVKSNVIVAVCAVLIAVNVAVFIFIPKILAPLALILSNAVTVLLMVIAFQPANRIMQEVFTEKAHELVKKEQEEAALREKVSTLESKYQEAMSKLDTWGQMSSAPMNLNFSARLETMLYDKSIYIVKEEPVEALLDNPRFGLTEKKGMADKLMKWFDEKTHKGERKVLYIGKHYAKESIGIDFSRVKFSTEEGRIAIYGASISKLADIETKPSETDINHCWVLNKGEEVITINTGDFYKELPARYEKACAEEAREAFNAEVDRICAHYTEIFRRNLAERFPGLVFCDSIEESPSTWYALKEYAMDGRIAPIVSSMFLMAGMLHGFNVISR